jgi:hypothetical protein
METLGGGMTISLMLSSKLLEETFFKIWGIQLEYILVLLKTLGHIKQTKNEIVK